MSTAFNTTIENNIGVLLRVDMGVDISTATATSFYIRKPGQKLATKFTATIADTRYLTYQTQADDLSLPGTYELEPELTLGDFIGRTQRVTFTVAPALET